MIFVRRDASNMPAGFEARRRERDIELAAALRADPDLSVSTHWSAIRRKLARDAAALFHTP